MMAGWGEGARCACLKNDGQVPRGGPPKDRLDYRSECRTCQVGATRKRARVAARAGKGAPSKAAGRSLQGKKDAPFALSRVPSLQGGHAIRVLPCAVSARRTCHSGFSVCRPCKEDTLFALSRVSPLQGGYAIRVFPCAVAAGKGGRGPRGGRPRPDRRRPRWFPRRDGRPAGRRRPHSGNSPGKGGVCPRRPPARG